jgi:hypothetical protein
MEISETLFGQNLELLDGLENHPNISTFKGI